MPEQGKGGSRSRSGAGKSKRPSGGTRKTSGGGSKRTTRAKSASESRAKSTASSGAKRKAPARKGAREAQGARAREGAGDACCSRAGMEAFGACECGQGRGQNTDPPPEERGSPWPVWIGVLAIIAAAVIGLILILGGDDDDNVSVDTSTTPTTALTPTATAPANTPPVPATPVTKPKPQSTNCDPIIGAGTANSGQSYPVTSTAPGAQQPADCGEARTVLLTALTGGSETVGQWRCTTDPSGSTIATCKSGTRTIEASSG